MKKTKTTARADETDVPVIEGARTTRIHDGAIQNTAVIYSGETPEVGQKMRFLLANGVTYEGTCKDFTAADGELLVEFSDGFAPVTTK